MNPLWPAALVLLLRPAPQEPTPVQGTVRDIVRAHTDAQGGVGADLAARTGWRTARGFRWQLLLSDADGRFRPADPGQTFATGQAFKLAIEADTDLWIYLLNRSPGGSEVVLFPEQDEQHLLIRKGQRVVVPGDGQFRFTDPPGTETFRILAASEKLPWVNPAELFQLENGATLDVAAAEKAHIQRDFRSKTIGDLLRRQAPPRVVSRPLDRVVADMAIDRELAKGMKNTVVVAPTTEGDATPIPDTPGDAGAAGGGAQQVVRVSTEPGDRQPIVFDVALKHSHP